MGKDQQTLDRFETNCSKQTGAVMWIMMCAPSICPIFDSTILRACSARWCTMHAPCFGGVDPGWLKVVQTARTLPSTTGMGQKRLVRKMHSSGSTGSRVT